MHIALQMNIVSMAPITASQFGTNRLMQTVVMRKSEADLTGAERFGSAAVAGAVSAFIASPSELIIIQQQVGPRPGRGGGAGGRGGRWRGSDGPGALNSRGGSGRERWEVEGI